jgi:hypothetical protein
LITVLCVEVELRAESVNQPGGIARQPAAVEPEAQRKLQKGVGAKHTLICAARDHATRGIVDPLWVGLW